MLVSKLSLVVESTRLDIVDLSRLAHVILILTKYKISVFSNFTFILFYFYTIFLCLFLYFFYFF